MGGKVAILVVFLLLALTQCMVADCTYNCVMDAAGDSEECGFEPV